MKFRDKQDKEITVEIVARGADWTKDFFNVGTLEKLQDGAYLIDSVDNLRETVCEFINHAGDYSELPEVAKVDASAVYVDGVFWGIEKSL